MTINRRQFLLSASTTGAGLFLPAIYDKAFNYLERTGEPLLAKPKRESIILSAVGDGSGEFQLNLGDPWQEPTPITLREFLRDHVFQSFEEYLEEQDLSADEVSLDEEVSYDYTIDTWCAYRSPNAKAFHLLADLDLGSGLEGPDAVGQVHFIDGPCPGSDYLGVHAIGPLSLSLLQYRLNQLGTGIHIKLARETPDAAAGEPR